MSMITSLGRWALRVFLALILGLALAVAGLYVYLQKNDIRDHLTQIVAPYAPKMRFEGPVHLGVWPSLHLEAENVTHDVNKMKRMRVHLPLIPLVQFALWRTPQKDMKLDIESLEVPGLEPINVSASCESKGDIFDCKVDATMQEWKTKFEVLYSPETTQLKGDIHYKNNTLHVVEGTLNNKSASFDGRVMLVGRDPIVVGTPKPIDIHYAHDTLTLKAPLVGLPQVELSNLKIKIKHHEKVVEVLEFEADAWHGHISTTGRVTWPNVVLKGKASNIQLQDIKELKKYVESGSGTCDWHITCNAEKALESLSGNTHLQLDPVSVQGIDLPHLTKEIKNLGIITPADVPHLKEKLFKPALMTVKCDMPISWRDGVGTIQKGQIDAAEIQTTLAGRIDAQKADLKAVIQGLPSCPSLPVNINGPWDHLSYTPDWSALLKGLMQGTAARATKDMRQKAEKEIKKAVESKLGDVGGASLQKEAGKLLGSLLG